MYLFTLELVVQRRLLIDQMTLRHFSFGAYRVEMATKRNGQTQVSDMRAYKYVHQYHEMGLFYHLSARSLSILIVAEIHGSILHK